MNRRAGPLAFRLSAADGQSRISANAARPASWVDGFVRGFQVRLANGGLKIRSMSNRINSLRAIDGTVSETLPARSNRRRKPLDLPIAIFSPAVSKVQIPDRAHFPGRPRNVYIVVIINDHSAKGELRHTVKTIGAAKFKSHCLALLDHLGADGLVVTKHGKPVARVLPYRLQDADLIGILRGPIKITGNINSTGIHWDANDQS